MRQSIAFFALIFVAVSVFGQEPAAPPASPWATSFGAGLAVTSGNSDTKNFNLSFSTKFDPKSGILFKSDALYLRGDANGEKQVDKLTADARGEYSLSELVFTFGEVNYLRDPFKDIDYFIAPLIGAGYRIIKSDTENLTVDGAVGAEMDSSSRGRSSSGALKAGENFDMAISPTSKITQKLSGIWKTNELADALYHFDAGLTTNVATHTDLKLAYVYDYKARPTRPGIKKGDSAIFAALMLKF